MKLITLLLLNGSLMAQYPILNHFTSSSIDGWSTSGQPSSGWHSPTYICTNISGNYLDDNNYMYESPSIDHTLCDSISVVFNVSYSIRASDDFYFSVNNGGWYYIPIPSPGTWGIDLPNTVTQIGFWLETFGNGNLNGKYNHIDYTIIDCYLTPLPVEFLKGYITCNNLEWETQSETNSSHFTIDYSEHAKVWNNYTDIDSKGSPSLGYKYILRILPNGYYRITQVDFNGNSKVLYIGYHNCNEDIDSYKVYTIDGKYIGNKIPNSSGAFILIRRNSNELIVK